MWRKIGVVFMHFSLEFLVRKLTWCICPWYCLSFCVVFAVSLIRVQSVMESECFNFRNTFLNSSWHTWITSFWIPLKFHDFEIEWVSTLEFFILCIGKSSFHGKSKCWKQRWSKFRKRKKVDKNLITKFHNNTVMRGYLLK